MKDKKKGRHTKEGRRRDSPIASWHHDADASLHKGHGEVNDLWPLLIDGQRTNCHHSLLVHHLVDREQWKQWMRALIPALIENNLVKFVNIWTTSDSSTLICSLSFILDMKYHSDWGYKHRMSSIVGGHFQSYHMKSKNTAVFFIVPTFLSLWMSPDRKIFCSNRCRF